MTMQDAPACQLGHRVKQRPEGVAEPSEAVEQWYELHPIPVIRPDDDEITAPVVCGTCGQSVDVVVASLAVRDRRRAGARSDRLLYRYLAVVAGLITLGGFLAAVVYGREMSSGSMILLLVVTFAAGSGAIEAHDTAGDRRRDEADDGVRLASPSAEHDVRRPGDDRDYDMRGDGYDPGGGE